MSIQPLDFSAATGLSTGAEQQLLAPISAAQAAISSAAAHVSLDVASTCSVTVVELSGQEQIHSATEADIPQYAALRSWLIGASPMPEAEVWDAIVAASIRGHHRVVEFLLKQLDTKMNLPVLSVALSHAVMEGHLEVFRCMITLRVFPVEVITTAAHTAALCGHLKLLQLIVDTFRMEDLQLERGFISAAFGGNVEIIRYLNKKMIPSLEVVYSALRVAASPKENVFFFMGASHAFMEDLQALSHQRRQQVIKVLLFENLAKYHSIHLAFSVLIKMRGSIETSLIYGCAERIFQRLPDSMREELETELIFSAKCLPVPQAFRMRYRLPSLFQESGLQALLLAVDQLNLTSDRVDASAIVRLVDSGDVGSLLQAIAPVQLSLEQYQRLSSHDRQLLLGRFRTYGFASAQSQATYSDYLRSYSLIAANYEKLVRLVRGKFLLQETSLLGDLGTPNPCDAPIRFKAWYQQIFEQLTYLENYRRGLKATDQESFCLELLTATDACAGRTQAVLSDLFLQHVHGCQSVQTVEGVFIRHLAKFHQQTVDKVKAKVIEEVGEPDAHDLNQVSSILSRFGFNPLVDDGFAPDGLDESEIIESFMQYYDLPALVEAIKQELDQDRLLKEQFTSCFDWSLTKQEIRQTEIKILKDYDLRSLAEKLETTFRERFLELRKARMTSGERSILPKNLTEESLFRRFQQVWGASASAAAPTFEQFAKQQREAAMPEILRRLVHHDFFNKKAYEEGLAIALERLELKKSPLNGDGTVKPEAVVEWLITHGLFC
jgi:hypothetical protein